MTDPEIEQEPKRTMTILFASLATAAVFAVLLCLFSHSQTQTTSAERGLIHRPSTQPTVPGTVTLTTDKTEYRQGETVTIAVKNGLDHSVWFLDAERGGRDPWWGLHRLEDGRWTQLEIWKPTRDKCLLVVSERIPLEQLAKELGPGSERTDQWTLTTCVVTSPIGPKFELNFVEPGAYRLFFRYGPDKLSRDDYTTYSETFAVREATELGKE